MVPRTTLDGIKVGNKVSTPPKTSTRNIWDFEISAVLELFCFWDW